MESKATLDKKYAKLLLDRDFLNLELTLSKPNIFTALKIANREIRHSNFLAWLLDPKQTHGLKTLFLKLVLADIFHDERIKELSTSDVANLPLEKAIIKREWGNIDILIHINDVVIVIENKIWSGESGTQLNTYKKLIEDNFKNKKCAYVFLSPFGIDASMKDVYINYSYERIVKILNLVKEVYSHGISNSVLIYIDDYLEIIKRNSMMTGDANLLARKIYSNHKELFDFILQNTPNPEKELTVYFERKVKETNWIRCTCERGFIRFLTPVLQDIIPRNGTVWKKEAFLFEFTFDKQGVEFYYTIAPGDEETRAIIKETIEKYAKPQAYSLDPGSYHCFSSIYMDIDVDTMNLSDTDFLDRYLKTFWKDILTAVDKAESAILKQSDKLLQIKIKSS
jgi:hypothetical protein